MAYLANIGNQPGTREGYGILRAGDHINYQGWRYITRSVDITILGTLATLVGIDWRRDDNTGGH